MRVIVWLLLGRHHVIALVLMLGTLLALLLSQPRRPNAQTAPAKDATATPASSPDNGDDDDDSWNGLSESARVF